jgi:segregation and condensation protein A
MEEQQYDQFTFDFNNEQPEISHDSQDALQLKIGEFAGPLDLLLFLIRQEQANIFDIPVAKITDEYLKYIKLMKRLDITIASDFLVMAAQLIEVKSRMLLPQDPKEVAEEGEVEDPREALVRQLLEHQKFKNAAEMLYEKVTVERAVFPRGRIESDDVNAEINATVFDLINVFQKILARQKEQIEFEIEREEISMADMLKELKRRLTEFKELSVTGFFEEMRSRRELVTAFIAILEIVRTEGIRLMQSATFGDIVLKKS